jgi:hypothetical protein
METTPKNGTSVHKKDKEERVDLDVIGSTGLQRSDGLINEEWLPQLKGITAVNIFRQMRDNDPIIGAFMFSVESLVRQVRFYAQPANKSLDAIKEAEFLESCMGDMNHTFSDLLSEVMSMLVYGWSYFELVYKIRKGPNQKDSRYRSRYSDGRIGWRKISTRAQNTLARWEIDEGGGIQGLWQVSPPTYNLVYVPIEKAILFRTQTNKNNPEGRSVLRNAFRPWYFKKKLEEIEAIGIERDLSGLPVLEVPPEIMAAGASAADKSLRTDLENMVQQIKRDEREGMVIPSELDQDGKPTGFRFKLLSSGGRRAVDVDGAIKRYESRMAMSVMAEFLMLGMDKVGSFALASTKTHMFSVALGALIDSVCQTFNRFAVTRLMTLNGVPVENWPMLAHGDIESPELKEIANYVVGLTDSGIIVPDERLEIRLREIAGLPMPEET